MSDDLRDLDETRRLAYMVQAATVVSAEYHDLAGTLMNALAHHACLWPASVTLAHVQVLLGPAPLPSDKAATDRLQDARVWLFEVIRDLTRRIEDHSAAEASTDRSA